MRKTAGPPGDRPLFRKPLGPIPGQTRSLGARSRNGALFLNTKKPPSGDERAVFICWLPMCNPLHNRSLSPAVNRKPSISTCYQRSGRSRRTGSGIKSHFRSWCHQGTALPVVELSQFMPQNGDGHECRIPFVIQNLGSRRFPMSTVRRSPDIRWKTRNRVRSYLG